MIGGIAPLPTPTHMSRHCIAWLGLNLEELHAIFLEACLVFLRGWLYLRLQRDCHILDLPYASEEHSYSCKCIYLFLFLFLFLCNGAISIWVILLGIGLIRPNPTEIPEGGRDLYLIVCQYLINLRSSTFIFLK